VSAVAGCPGNGGSAHFLIHEEWALALVPLRLTRLVCGMCKLSVVGWTLRWKRKRR
jgi:hypothetical protein